MALTLLRCGNEGAVVGTIEATGPLTAPAIRSGLRARDAKRCPLDRDIQEGAQLFCRSCSGTLYLETAAGQHVACVGTISVE